MRLSSGAGSAGNEGEAAPEGDGQTDDLIHYFGHLDGLKSVFTLQENLAFWRTLYGAGEPDIAISIGGQLQSADDAPNWRCRHG